jgi:hypothetical protein
MFRTATLPVVLDKCDTLPLMVGEGCRLEVFDNMVLRKIFVPKRDKVTGDWRRLHNEELYHF